MRRRSPALVLLALAAVGLTACTGGASTASRSAILPAGPAAPVVDAATAAGTAAGTAVATTPASPTATPTPARPPAPAYDVVAVQKRLTELSYYAGPVDGRPGTMLAAAVMAFQKVQGLSVDGDVGPQVLGALAAPKPVVLKATAPADRVEVDLAKQVLYVVKGGAIVRIMAVSSGNGATYKNSDGSTAKALTPVGWFTIGRRLRGPEVAPLGVLFDPQYFYQGWAIHGSDSVPAYPASHGCVRVNRWDGTWLFGQLGAGSSVYLYGGAYTFSAGSRAAGTTTPGGDPAAKPPAPAQPAATGSPTAPASPTSGPPRSSPTSTPAGLPTP